MADNKDPIGRRMKGKASLPGKPEDHIDQGISALDHADIPMETKHMIAKVLFAAKTHGSKGLNSDHLFQSSGVKKPKKEPKVVVEEDNKDAD